MKTVMVVKNVESLGEGWGTKRKGGGEVSSGAVSLCPSQPGFGVIWQAMRDDVVPVNPNQLLHRIVCTLKPAERYFEI